MKPRKPIEPLPGMFRQSLEGQHDWWCRFVRDYGQCVKDKAIATASCKTWDETVDHLITDAIELGRAEALLDMDDHVRGSRAKSRASKRRAREDAVKASR